MAKLKSHETGSSFKEVTPLRWILLFLAYSGGTQKYIIDIFINNEQYLVLHMLLHWERMKCRNIGDT